MGRYYRNPNPDMDDVISDAYDRATYSAVKTAKDGLFGFLATGFGKGLLAAAALIVGGFALGFGLAGASGDLAYVAADGTRTAVGFGGGLLGGAEVGMGMLTQGPGLAALAVGGLAGAALTYSSKKQDVQLQLDEARARQAMRGMQPEMVMQPELEQAPAIVQQQPVQQQPMPQQVVAHAPVTVQQQPVQYVPVPQPQQVVTQAPVMVQQPVQYVVPQQVAQAPVAMQQPEMKTPEPAAAMAQQPAREPSFRDRIKKRERAESFVAEEDNRRAASAVESRYQGVV